MVITPMDRLQEPADDVRPIADALAIILNQQGYDASAVYIDTVRWSVREPVAPTSHGTNAIGQGRI